MDGIRADYAQPNAGAGFGGATSPAQAVPAREDDGLDQTKPNNNQTETTTKAIKVKRRDQGQRHLGLSVVSKEATMFSLHSAVRF